MTLWSRLSQQIAGDKRRMVDAVPEEGTEGTGRRMAGGRFQEGQPMV